MKIKDAIKNGKLPNIRIEDIFRILDSLGIKVSQNNRTEDYVLDDKIIDIIRPIANASISYTNHVTEVNNDIKTTHNNLLNNYDNFISKYTDILSSMQKDPSHPIDLNNIDLNDFQDYFKSDVKDLITQITKLEDAKKNYENIINGIDLTHDNLGLDEKVLNDFESKNLKGINTKLGQTEAELQEYQEQLDKLNNLKVTSKFKQKRINKKRRKIEERINKLKNKKGILQTKQTKLVNKGSNKYIQIKSKEFENIMTDYERMDSYQSAMSENQRLQEGLSNDLISTKEELDSLRGKTGIKAAYERNKLERESKRLENQHERLVKQAQRINNLKNKKGYCNLSNQILRSYTAAYSM